MLEEGISVAKNEGFWTLMRKIPPFAYQQIWPYLPKENRIVMNGIESNKHHRIPDDYLPEYLTQYIPKDNPEYEALYIDCLRQHVQDGNTIVMIGGGEGISTIVAARSTGSEGSVVVYEGGSAEFKKTRDLVGYHGLYELTEVNHAIVSTDFSLRSDAGAAEIVSPASIPECDVLAIDADGAELPILEGLEIRPRRLIVEHHIVLEGDEVVMEYQPDSVRSHLRGLGYEVVREVSEPSRAYGEYEECVFVAELN